MAAIQDEYRRSGVDYEVLDRIKRDAIALAGSTSHLLHAAGGSEVKNSRGASAYVFDLDGLTLALVGEGLGTKSAIANEFYIRTGISRFADIAKDAVASIVNDIISVGALPLVVTAYFSTGDASWYADEKRSHDLLEGWKSACEEAGATWGGGESPALPGVLLPDALELAGSSIGVVPLGRRPVLGDEVSPGDGIVLLASTGIHANGSSLARRVAETEPQGLLTVLPSGRMLGDALLDPGPTYVPFVRNLLSSEVMPKFLNGITGHGFLKIMRGPADVCYKVTSLPEVPEVLQFLVDALDMQPEEAYSTLNMGAGYVAIISSRDVDQTLVIAEKSGYTAIVAGEVTPGPRALMIPSLGVEYTGGDLQLA
jgi:phosphoribosylformylglycinamidine cyclo-ligase